MTQNKELEREGKYNCNFFEWETVELKIYCELIAVYST